MIAESLNSIENPKFTVNHRSVRERYTILEKNYVKKNNAEEKATGISPDEMSDLDKALEEIVGKFKDLEIKVKQTQEEAENVTKDRETATEMRKKCMETYAETNKRKGEQSNPKRTPIEHGSIRSATLFPSALGLPNALQLLLANWHGWSSLNRRVLCS